MTVPCPFCSLPSGQPRLTRRVETCGGQVGPRGPLFPQAHPTSPSCPTLSPSRAGPWSHRGQPLVRSPPVEPLEARPLPRVPALLLRGRGARQRPPRRPGVHAQHRGGRALQARVRRTPRAAGAASAVRQRRARRRAAAGPAPQAMAPQLHRRPLARRRHRLDAVRRRGRPLAWVRRARDGRRLQGDRAWFVYANGLKTADGFHDTLRFDTRLVPYDGDRSSVLEAFRAAVSLAVSRARPGPGPECPWCRYAAAWAG